MKVGNIDFNENLKNLSLSKFKKLYKDGDFEKKTGEPVEKVAKMLGIKVPKQD